MGFDDRDIQYALNGDIHVAYMVVGTGSVDVVWSSPGISNLEGFWGVEQPLLRGLGERLSSFSRFITYDQRGTGLSDPVPSQAIPTLEERGDDLRAVLDAAGSKQAVIIGQGHGGAACMLLAGTYPDRVSALVLYDTYARWQRDDDYPAGMPSDATQRFCQSVVEAWGTGATVEGFVPTMAHDPDLRRSWATSERVGASKAGIRSLMKMWTETDVRAILPSITVPTLVLHREEDLQFRIGHGRYLAEHIPGAKLVELPGKDHLAREHELDAMVGEIEEFVTGARHPEPTDRVLATVLFTDIVQSTLKVSEPGDRRWRELLDRHDRIMTAS